MSQPRQPILDRVLERHDVALLAVGSRSSRRPATGSVDTRLLVISPFQIGCIYLPLLAYYCDEIWELLETAGGLPMFRSSLLLVGDRDPADVRRQLSRWVASGKVIQLRRDVYVLAAPWRVIEPHPFLVANELHRPSYVSLQSALGYHGLIPEAVRDSASVSLRPSAILRRSGFRSGAARAERFRSSRNQ